MKSKYLAFCFFTAILGFTGQPARSKNENISPLYFGPNALPVPEMTDGTVFGQPYLEGAIDLHTGFFGDVTRTLFVKTKLPLFSSRINLSVWMPVIEFYTNTPASLDWQKPGKPSIKGYEFGNVYVSTDIHLLQEDTFKPDIAFRAAVITASGGGRIYARNFDLPGYFFDATVSKSIRFGQGFFRDLRLAFNGGFLCWQTDSRTQNDAYMYGIMGSLSTRIADIALAWQGYTGWQKNGDRPMVIRLNLTFRAGRLRPVLGYEYGIRDYPFSRFRAGIGYLF